MLAVRRRWSLAVRGNFDPYPLPPPDLRFSPSDLHIRGYEQAPTALSWRNMKVTEPESWQRTARDKLAELMGCTLAPPPPTNP